MAKQFNANKQKYFVLIPQTGRDGSVFYKNVSFRTYTDHANILGKGFSTGVQYIEGTDDKGKPKGKWFEMNSTGRRRFMVREDQKDTQGISMYDFLKNAPDCEGSPNAPEGHTPLYREMNEAKDAKVANEANKIRTKAMATLYQLEEVGDWETLSEVGAHIGCFEEPGEILVHHIAEWTDKRPEDFLEVLNAGDRPVRAAIRKAINSGLFTKKETLIYWNNTLIGNNEDSAVARILEDKDMAEALKGILDLKKEKPKKK